MVTGNIHGNIDRYWFHPLRSSLNCDSCSVRIPSLISSHHFEECCLKEKTFIYKHWQLNKMAKIKFHSAVSTGPVSTSEGTRLTMFGFRICRGLALKGLSTQICDVMTWKHVFGPLWEELQRDRNLDLDVFFDISLNIQCLNKQSSCQGLRHHDTEMISM